MGVRLPEAKPQGLTFGPLVRARCTAFRQQPLPLSQSQATLDRQIAAAVDARFAAEMSWSWMLPFVVVYVRCSGRAAIRGPPLATTPCGAPYSEPCAKRTTNSEWVGLRGGPAGLPPSPS